MVYVGIGKNDGKVVSQEESKEYVINEIKTDESLRDEFLQMIFNGEYESDLSAESIIEWFFSGSWVEKHD